MNPAGFPVLILESIFLFSVIFFLLRWIARNRFAGAIKYKTALGYGVIVSALVAFILGAVNAYHVTEMVDDKAFRKQLFEMYSLQNYQQGLRGDELSEKTLLSVDSHLNPTVQFFSNFIGYFIAGFLFSLISASILRKPAKPIQFKDQPPASR